MIALVLATSFHDTRAVASVPVLLPVILDAMPATATVTPAPTSTIRTLTHLNWPTATPSPTPTNAPTSTPPPSPTPFTPSPPWEWPIHNTWLVQGFGSEHPGWDLSGVVGRAVTSVADGRVTFADWSDAGYGYMVIVDHGGGVQTRYAHLLYIVVTEGQTVHTGDQVGVMGGSGNVDGWHLHFEVRCDGQAVDPALYLVSR